MRRGKVLANQTQITGQLPYITKNSDVLMAVAVVGILVFMVMPLPTMLLDLLLSFSITLSLIILLASMYVQRPLELSAFPSILLLGTLFRLSLNVASTRIILLHGNEGTMAAGKVIMAFGGFVVGGNYLVGIIVFLILVAINSIMQMILIPVYAKLLLGKITFDVWLVAESVILYLGLPLLAGFITRHFGVQKYGEAGFSKIKTYLDTLSILGLLFTLVVMFALKGDLILEKPQIILQMAIPMTIFFWSLSTRT